MNWMTRIAILFGRKKFEEFAQANPQLPDDALAVANTLDTYAVVNTAIQKQAVMSVYCQDCRFPGSAHANDIRDPHAVPIQRQLLQVEIICNGDPPSGASLVVQLLFGGTAQSPTFALGAGNDYALINATADNTVLPAGTPCSAQIVTPSGASDVVVKLYWQLVIP
ncbi:MAG: hypothetical protein ABSA12_10485 [Verrucomicrobiia bacterium]|jgi:hypothetical protein